ncbi:uncharacterized protein B0T15DRAFT_541096 [Chaetomium strumarium]|uniref:Ankyrin repeat protein n=1 Tax=Chaetomium strumarium TaxID=1170767 RepID=A0AAJ0GPX1_9PEZI|nr:hypothetical protein B0T15DRAFT_541096 [Chaetomium strumarium]
MASAFRALYPLLNRLKGDFVRFSAGQTVEKGVNITVVNNNGLIPVYSIAINGYLNTVKFLVNNGVDITVANNNS